MDSRNLSKYGLGDNILATAIINDEIANMLTKGAIGPQDVMPRTIFFHL